MNIKFQESAKKDLKKIDKINIIKILKEIKKLKNFYPPQRLRVDNYRVLFDIEDNDIIIVRIKHRKDSYR